MAADKGLAYLQQPQECMHHAVTTCLALLYFTIRPAHATAYTLYQVLVNVYITAIQMQSLSPQMSGQCCLSIKFFQCATSHLHWTINRMLEMESNFLNKVHTLLLTEHTNVYNMKQNDNNDKRRLTTSLLSYFKLQQISPIQSRD